MGSSSVWSVYILRCRDDSVYIGSTTDLESRVLKHNDGSASRFTATRRPVTLVYSGTARNMRRRFEA